MQQTINFNAPVQKVVNNSIQRYEQSEKDESKTWKFTVSLTATQKDILRDICFDSNIGVSTFIAQALECYIKVYPYREKIHRHSDHLVDLLSRLS